MPTSPFKSLYWKIAGTFILILTLFGLGYVGITAYFANQFFEEANQKLHAQVANHLIQEKFKDQMPFLADGSINKPLFGDIMHDMMAVNRRIEVYLLDTIGMVKYSVVLDHEAPEANTIQVDTGVIHEFIRQPGEQLLLGENPLNMAERKAFSAAEFDIQGQKGFIYIILDSEVFDSVSYSLLGTYIGRLGSMSMLLTLLGAIGIGLLIIWFLIKNLRRIIGAVKEFEQGDLQARAQLKSQGELSMLADSFNHMADTIVRNIEEIKQTETLRKELIANVSHDLRNPLAIIQGYAETLQIKGIELPEAERQNYIEVILKSLERLNRLVGELFELSRLESNQVKLVTEAFDIRELVSDVSEKFSLMAQQKQVQFEFSGFEAPLPKVVGDISLIERVLQNLLDNAFKFTPSGGKIILQLDAKSEGVEVTVSDTGVGIPKEDIPHLFERYYTRNRTGDQKNAGSGLGLAIVNKIMELHNRVIQVRSEPQKGTSFSFSLPQFA